MKEQEITATAADGHRVSILASEKSIASASLVFVHGLAGDKDEAGGLFQNAVDAMGVLPVETFRFDFRGHGQSSYKSQDMTLTGELADLVAVCNEIDRRNNLPFVFVAASLGAVSVALLMSRSRSINAIGLALWNPVLQPRKTFVDPGTPWSREAFGGFENDSTRTLELGDFTVGRSLWNEFCSEELSAETWTSMVSSKVPTIILHGESDQIVPYSISQRLKIERPEIELVGYPDELHGMFGVHDDLIAKTKRWVSGLISGYSRSNV